MTQITHAHENTPAHTTAHMLLTRLFIEAHGVTTSFASTPWAPSRPTRAMRKTRKTHAAKHKPRQSPSNGFTSLPASSRTRCAPDEPAVHKQHPCARNISECKHPQRAMVPLQCPTSQAARTRSDHNSLQQHHAAIAQTRRTHTHTHTHNSK